MALFKYLKPINNLPNPNGPLSAIVNPSITAEVNCQVRTFEHVRSKECIVNTLPSRKQPLENMQVKMVWQQQEDNLQEVQRYSS